MSLLKKWFGAKSEGSTATLALSPAQKRAAPRVRLLPLHRISFKVGGPEAAKFGGNAKTGLNLEVANVSMTGIGFTQEGVVKWPAPGSEIAGELRLEESQASVQLKIVHFTGKIAGCAFLGEIAGAQRLVLEYFRTELAALQMILAPTDILQADAQGNPHWYHGKNNCELFYVTAPDATEALLRFQLSFFANYVEGGDGRVRFGTVVEDNAFDKPRHKESSLVKWEPTSSPEMIEAAVRFLCCVPELPAPILGVLVRQVRSGRVGQ